MTEEFLHDVEAFPVAHPVGRRSVAQHVRPQGHLGGLADAVGAALGVGIGHRRVRISAVEVDEHEVTLPLGHPVVAFALMAPIRLHQRGRPRHMTGIAALGQRAVRVHPPPHVQMRPLTAQPSTNESGRKWMSLRRSPSASPIRRPMSCKTRISRTSRGLLHTPSAADTWPGSRASGGLSYSLAFNVLAAMTRF